MPKALSRRTLVAAGALAAGSGFVPKRVFAQKKVQIKYTLGWLPEGAKLLNLGQADRPGVLKRFRDGSGA